MELVALLTGNLERFLLVLFRVSGIMASAPFWGSSVMIPQVRIALALVLAVVVTPLLHGTYLPAGGTGTSLLLSIFLELAVGLLIGFVGTLVFVGVQFAGHLVGTDLGITLASVIDPISNEQSSVVGQFYFLLAMFVFLAMEGPYLILSALFSSFAAIPCAGLGYPERLVQEVGIKMCAQIFVTGLQLAAPVMVALFLTTVALGLLGRAVPETNIFSVGFSVRIGVGFVMMVASLPLVVAFMRYLFLLMNGNLQILIRAVSHG